MSNNVVHFAIHAADCDRAKAFYEQAFGWTFEPWGPPDFWLIHTGEGGILGALQKRRHAVEGQGMIGFECTISVEDVHSTARAIADAGGVVKGKPMAIQNVGTVLQFEDTEGNVVCAMQYEEGVLS